MAGQKTKTRRVAGAVSFKANDFDPRQLGGIIISAKRIYDLFMRSGSHVMATVST
jgi:hypothetical protein